MFGFNLNKFVEKVQQQVPVAKLAVSTLVGDSSSVSSASPPPSPPSVQRVPGAGQPGRVPSQQQQQQPPVKSPVPPIGGGGGGVKMSGSGSGVFQQQQQSQPRPIPTSGSGMGLRQPSPASGSPSDRFSPSGRISGTPSPRMMSPQPPRPPSGGGGGGGGGPSGADMMADLAGLSEEERMHIAAVLQRAQMEMDAAMDTPPPSQRKPPSGASPQQQPPFIAQPPPIQQQQQPSVPPPQSSSLQQQKPVPTVTINQPPPSPPQRFVPPPSSPPHQMPSPNLPHQNDSQHESSSEEEELPDERPEEDEEIGEDALENNELHRMDLLEPDREQRRLLFGSSDEGSSDHDDLNQHQPQQLGGPAGSGVYHHQSGQRYDGFADSRQMVHEEEEPSAHQPDQGRFQQQQQPEPEQQTFEMELESEYIEDVNNANINNEPVSYADDVAAAVDEEGGYYPPEEEEEELKVTVDEEQQQVEEIYYDDNNNGGQLVDAEEEAAEEEFMRQQIMSPTHDEEMMQETPEPPLDEEQMPPDQPISYSLPRQSSSSSHSQQQQQQQDEAIDFRPLMDQQQFVIPRNDDYYYQTVRRTSQENLLTDMTSSLGAEQIPPQQQVPQEPDAEIDDFEFATRIPARRQPSESGDHGTLEPSSSEPAEEDAGLELCPICRDAALDIDLDTSKVCADCERYVCKSCGNYEQPAQQPGQVGDLSFTPQQQQRLRQWLCVECEARRQLEIRRTLTEKWAVSSSQSKKDRNRLQKAATISTELAHDMPQPHPVTQEGALALTSGARLSGSGASSSPSKGAESSHVVRRKSLPEAFDLEQAEMENSMQNVQEILADDTDEAALPPRHHHRDEDEDRNFDIDRSMSIGPSASEVAAASAALAAAGTEETDEKEAAAAAIAADRLSETTIHRLSSSDRSTQLTQVRSSSVQQQPQKPPPEPAEEQPIEQEMLLASPVDESAILQHQNEESTTFSTRVQPILSLEEEFGTEPELEQYQQKELVRTGFSRLNDGDHPSGGDVLLPETEFEYQEVRWYSKYSDENLQQSAAGTGPSDQQAPSLDAPAATGGQTSSAVIPPIPFGDADIMDYPGKLQSQQPTQFSLTMTVEQMANELIADEPPREFGVVIRAPNAAAVPPEGSPHDFSRPAPPVESGSSRPGITSTSEPASSKLQYPQQAQSPPEFSLISNTPPSVPPSADLQNQWLQQFSGSTDFSYHSGPPSQPPPPPPIPPRQGSPGQQPAPTGQALPSQTWPPASSTPGLPSDLSPILDVSPSIEEFEEELMIEQQKQMREAEEHEHEDFAQVEEYFDEHYDREKLQKVPSGAEQQQQQLQKQQLSTPHFSEEELSSFYKCDDLSSSFSRLKKSPKFECGLSDLVSAQTSSNVGEATAMDVDATAIPHSESGGDIQMESLGSFNIMVKPVSLAQKQTSSSSTPSQQQQQAAQSQQQGQQQPVAAHDIDEFGEDRRMDESYETNYESVHSISEDIVKSFSLDAASFGLREEPLVGATTRPVPQQQPKLQPPPPQQPQKPTPPPPPPKPSVAPVPPPVAPKPKVEPVQKPPQPQVIVPPQLPPKTPLVQSKSAPRVPPPPTTTITPPPAAAPVPPVPVARPPPPAPPAQQKPPAPAPVTVCAPQPAVKPTIPEKVPSPAPAVVKSPTPAPAQSPSKPSPQPPASPASRKQLQEMQQQQYQATLASQVERRDNFLRGSSTENSPAKTPTGSTSTPAAAAVAAVVSPKSPAQKQQPSPATDTTAKQQTPQRVTFQMSPPASTTSSTEQQPTRQPSAPGPATAPKKKSSVSIKELQQPAASSSTSATGSSVAASGESATTATSPQSPTSAVSAATSSSSAASASSSARSRARRKLPEVPPNAEPFSGISSLLQLAALQRSTSPQQGQLLTAGSSRTLPRSTRFATDSTTPSGYRSLLSGGIKRSSSAGRGTINGDQSPENSGLLVEANQQQQTTATSDRHVGFNLPGARPLFINTAAPTSSTATTSHFRSRSLPQSPGSHVSPRFSGSPIRVPSPGVANIIAGVVGDGGPSPKMGSPRIATGTPRFVHLHGLTVPIEIKEVKDQLNLEIRLATANRRRLLDELEIRRLERQLEEIRELERQQKLQMQKRITSGASDTAATAPVCGGGVRPKFPTPMQSSPTLRSALAQQNKSPGQSGTQMSVSFMQQSPLGRQQQPPQLQLTPPRLLEPSRWPPQKYPLQKQHSDPALFSPVDEMYGDLANDRGQTIVMGADGNLRLAPISLDDSSNRLTSNYGTLPRGGIISPNTGRIIPLSKYRKGDTEFPSPPINTGLASSSQQQLLQQASDEIDAHVALLKDEIIKRKEQIEDTRILEGELYKLTEEAKKRCEHLQTRIVTSDFTAQPPPPPPPLSQSIPSNIVPPLGPNAVVTPSSSLTMNRSNIIRPLAPESPMAFGGGSRMVTSPPSYADIDPYSATMPQPIRMAPDFAQFHHAGPLLRPQTVRNASPPFPPPGMQGPPGPPLYQQQLPACAHCHSVYHHSHQPGQQPPPPPPPGMPHHSHHSPFAPPGFPPGHYEDFTSRSMPGTGPPLPMPQQQQQQQSQQQQQQQPPIGAPVPGQRLAGSHAEMGGFQDFASSSRHIMCPHCSVHAGSTNHLLHHHPAGDFNHHPGMMPPQTRGVLAGLGQQPVNQLIGRTTADGGRNDPSQLNAKRRSYPYPVKRILLTRDPRDKSVRSNGLGMRIVGGKQVPGGPEGELGAFVAQVFQGGVADQLHGEVKEGDQVLEWNGVTLGGRTFEDVLQIINQPCEEIEIVVKAGDPYYSSSTSQLNRPHSQHSFYDNMEPASTEFNDINNVMTTSSTGQGDMFGDGRPVGRRGVPYYADERDIAMSRGGSRQRLPSTGSNSRGFGSSGHVRSGPRPESSSSAEMLNADQQQGALPLDQQPPGTNMGGSSAGEIQLALNFDEYERLLTVEVLRARDLCPQEDHLPSPYVRLRLNPVKGQNCIQTSSQLYSTPNPEFHQAFSFTLSSVASLSRRTMDICLWDLVDADRKRERLIGETVISMANSSLLDGRPHWFRLRPPSPAGMTPIEMPPPNTTSSSTMNAIVHPQPVQPAHQQQVVSPPYQPQQPQQPQMMGQQDPQMMMMMMGQQQQQPPQMMMSQPQQQPQMMMMPQQQPQMMMSQQPQMMMPQQQPQMMMPQQQPQMMMSQQPQQFQQQPSQMMPMGNGSAPYGMMNGAPNNGTVQTGFANNKPQQDQSTTGFTRQRHLTAGGNTVATTNTPPMQGNQPTPAHHRSVYFDDQIRCVDDYPPNNVNSMSQYR